MKHKFTLDISEAEVSFADTAFSFWQTAMINFEFAHSLNRIYNLDLERRSDMKFFGLDIDWPYYSYFDDESKLRYDLIDKPFNVGKLNPMFDTTDKILIVTGRDAWDMTRRMASDSEQRNSDIPVLARFAADVFTVETFDFDPYSGHTPQQGTAAFRHFDAVKALCEKILAALDINDYA